MTWSRKALVLYEYGDEVEAILQRHGFEGDDVRSALEERIVRRFRRSMLEVPSRVQLSFLKRHFPTQADRARLIGLSRSAWSRIEKSGIMKKSHLLAIHAKFSQLTYPSPDEAVQEAAVSTISYIQRKELKRSHTGLLIREEYEILHEMIADQDWLEAQKTDSVSARKAAFDLIRSTVDRMPMVKTKHVDSYWLAEYLLECWREAFLVGVYLIPFEEKKV